MIVSEHECGPHPSDALEEGWTNCHVCWKPIRIEGEPRGRCVAVSHIGRCDLAKGHADSMHITRGVAW